MADKDGRRPTRDEEVRKIDRKGTFDHGEDKAQVPRDEYKQPLKPWPERPKKK